ncbi:hypothetical protein INR49_002251 [Caranx melampygus]|nr:hypothetical protein INR49_002251 [Caranx melampygus]
MKQMANQITCNGRLDANRTPDTPDPDRATRPAAAAAAAAALRGLMAPKEPLALLILLSATELHPCNPSVLHDDLTWGQEGQELTLLLLSQLHLMENNTRKEERGPKHCPGLLRSQVFKEHLNPCGHRRHHIPLQQLCTVIDEFMVSSAVDCSSD